MAGEVIIPARPAAGAGPPLFAGRCWSGRLPLLALDPRAFVAGPAITARGAFPPPFPGAAYTARVPSPAGSPLRPSTFAAPAPPPFAGRCDTAVPPRPAEDATRYAPPAPARAYAPEGPRYQGAAWQSSHPPTGLSALSFIAPRMALAAPVIALPPPGGSCITSRLPPLALDPRVFVAPPTVRAVPPLQAGPFGGSCRVSPVPPTGQGGGPILAGLMKGALAPGLASPIPFAGSCRVSPTPGTGLVAISPVMRPALALAPPPPAELLAGRCEGGLSVPALAVVVAPAPLVARAGAVWWPGAAAGQVGEGPV